MFKQIYCLYDLFYRYSDNTIAALEILDNDDKIDLDLIVALIRRIVLSEDVSLTLFFWFQCGRLKVATFWCLKLDFLMKYFFDRDGNGVSE